MTISAISLCSRALLKIGAGGITSFTDGTAEAEVAANLYPSIRDAMLSSYPWSFALAQTSLPRLLEPPASDFAYAYALPSDFLRVISAGDESKGKGMNYRIIEKQLHTNREHVVLTYIFRQLEENFPPFFENALIARLASEFCLPLTESTSRAEFLLKQADSEFKQARLIDSQQNIPKSIDNFSLVEVRL